MYDIITLADALHRLGVSELYPWQKVPQQVILRGDDIFVSAPTGGGKSLLFQLPSIMEEGQAITLVISPLRALQVDQAQQLQAKGIPVAILNSDLSASERRSVLEQLPDLCMLYLAPEQLRNSDLAEALSRCQVARVVVDEAHILPDAMLGFRKAYGRIGAFISSLPERPQVIACTATARPRDRKQILKALGVPDAKVFTSPVRRENLRLHVKKVDDRKNTMYHSVERALKHWKKHSKRKNRGSVIIYCPTVKGVKRLHKFLKARGWHTKRYTGKTSQKKRRETQEAFLSGETPIIIGTNAFGLGINKPDVRLIIHAGLPLTMSGYVQEIGRAGRDGKKADCILLYTKGDAGRNKNILSQGNCKAARRGIKDLDALKRLVQSGKCLWRGIEKYYGERPQKRCGTCCRCRAKHR